MSAGIAKCPLGNLPTLRIIASAFEQKEEKEIRWQVENIETSHGLLANIQTKRTIILN